MARKAAPTWSSPDAAPSYLGTLYQCTAGPRFQTATGRDNQTHSEQVPVKFVPAPDGTERSDFKVTNLRFFRWEPGHVNDWHPAPQKQFVITLSGRGEVEIAGGQKIAMQPGRIILAEDVTGKGHITRTIGHEVWVRVTIPLAAP